MMLEYVLTLMTFNTVKKKKVVKGVIKAVKMALENTDKRYCKLSRLDYSEPEVKELKKEKYLERPFAYEFYHQLRKLMDEGKVDFGGPIVQAEVNKLYQHLFKEGKVPDFIIHVPNTDENLAVIEFKLASNLEEIQKDFEKMLEFKSPPLNYKHLIEIIIGNRASLEKAIEQINNLVNLQGEKITIIKFNVDSWKAKKVKYDSNQQSFKADYNSYLKT